MVQLQALRKDKGVWEEAMAALKSRNEELVPQVQQLEVQLKKLMCVPQFLCLSTDVSASLQAQVGKLQQKEESARKQWESLRDGYKSTQQKCLELQTENKKLIEQMKKFGDMANEGAQFQRMVAEQGHKITALEKEKEDLWNELQAAKAGVSILVMAIAKRGCPIYIHTQLHAPMSLHYDLYFQPGFPVC